MSCVLLADIPQGFRSPIGQALQAKAAALCIEVYKKIAHLILSCQELGFSRSDVHCRQWTHQNNVGINELTTSVLFSPIIFLMHHPASQPSSCFFTVCTLRSLPSSARSWKWSWEKETHGQLVMLTSSLLPWEARWKWLKLQGGHHQDRGGQSVSYKTSDPPARPSSHNLMYNLLYKAWKHLKKKKSPFCLPTLVAR